MSALALILQILRIAAGAAAPLLKGDPTAEEAAQLAASLAQIGSAANQAHIAIAGTPIDLTKLQPIDPLP